MISSIIQYRIFVLKVIVKVNLRNAKKRLENKMVNLVSINRLVQQYFCLTFISIFLYYIPNYFLKKIFC